MDKAEQQPDANPTNVPPLNETEASSAEAFVEFLRDGAATSETVDHQFSSLGQFSPLRLRDLVVVLCLVVVCDVTIYRGAGFAGLALLFGVAPALLWAGSLRRPTGAGVWIVAGMLAALAAKLVWCGSEGLVIAGFALLVAYSMALAGQCPYVLEAVIFASQTIRAGYECLTYNARALDRFASSINHIRWLNFVLPAGALLVFGMIFTLANPDLFAAFSERAEFLLNQIHAWLVHFSFWEIYFWIAVVWISLGLLRPSTSQTFVAPVAPVSPVASVTPVSPAESFMYPAYRNTLVTVIVLFAAYLAFEFKTLWLRVFPDGFYYSGYAHEGAAWLTLALALATLLLSVVFKGRVLRDPRVARLRRLAWIWSLQNFLLVAAVYHRLLIYSGFNGLTRMRMVGIFGISTVAVGFFLVLWKIAHNRDFAWLIRRHLWTLSIATYLFLLTPIDTIVVSYNVRRILAGDPAPSVQISVHPISSEGILLLRPLLHCDDETIREGVRAMLAQRDAAVESLALNRLDQGWTAHQLADEWVLTNLRASRPNWVSYAGFENRDKQLATLERFRKYAYQWY